MSYNQSEAVPSPMAYPATYQADDAALIQPLASLANGNVGALTFIPGGWTIIQAISDAGSGVQAILATNTLPSTGDTALILAIGQLWPGMLGDGYFSGKNSDFALTALSSTISGQSSSSPSPPHFCGAYQTQYAIAEKLLFKVLRESAISKQVSGLPLIIVGQAQGAPLAQLAAMAFRKSRSGLPAKLHTTACYTFSTPPMGDANFAALLTTTIPASFNVYADRVDFFASTPEPFKGAVRAGIAQPLTAQIPTLPDLNNAQVDDPWREHSGAYYTGLLKTPTSATTNPGSVTSPPSTFSANLAETLTQMISVAYQQTQHPNLPISPAVTGFTLNSFLSSGSTRWGAIFTDAPNHRIFVVFRGEICFEETVNALTQAGMVYPPYLPSVAAVSPGMDAIYSGLRTALRTQAAAALTRVAGTSIIMTGHGAGGVLANIAALDFATQGGGLPVPAAIYTFGAPPSGDPNFQSLFNTQFGTGTSTPVSFQLTRNSDPFPQLMMLPGAPFTVGTNLVLNGPSPYDDNIFHSLTSYIALLNSN